MLSVKATCRTSFFCYSSPAGSVTFAFPAIDLLWTREWPWSFWALKLENSKNGRRKNLLDTCNRAGEPHSRGWLYTNQNHSINARRKRTLRFPVYFISQNNNRKPKTDRQIRSSSPNRWHWPWNSTSLSFKSRDRQTCTAPVFWLMHWYTTSHISKESTH